ncbi:MAG: UDP-N-acetylmuramate dehydrogenase [Desulfobacterales bacterium]|nr:UDP-N-acetylmuramate dehydrogenase [Desulfobacterales bacterium]
MNLDADTKSWLMEHFESCVLFDEPMAKHTSLHVGGPASAFVTPEDIEGLSRIIKWSWQNQIPFLITGDGTNLLVKDNGFKGIVIALTKGMNTISRTVQDNKTSVVTAMAGVRMKQLCSYAIENGLGGMNFAVGIPGTVGGGIKMNAGAASGGAMEKVLDSIIIMVPDGSIQYIRRNRLKFEYRKLTWDMHDTGFAMDQTIILEGIFNLHTEDSGRLRTEAEEMLLARKNSQPRGVSSAGCFFKNPVGGPSAGELIDNAGLKKKRIGGAEVSSRHANFIVNTGSATASDLLELMTFIKTSVSKQFGVELETEVKIVGE